MVSKLILLGILFLTSFILALRVVSVAKLVVSGILTFRIVSKLVMSGILSSIFFILALYTSFITTSIFTKSLSLLKSTGTGTNYQHLIDLLYFSNCLN